MNPANAAGKGILMINAEASPSTLPLVIPKPYVRKKNLFGREDLANAYHAASDIIFKYGLTRLYTFEELEDGAGRLIICGIWRIDVDKNRVVATYKLDLKTGEFKPDIIATFNLIPLYPFVITKGKLHWWKHLVDSAISEAINVTGLDRDIISPSCSDLAADIKNSFPTWRAAKILRQRFTGEKGLLNPDVMRNISKGLVKVIHQKVLDKEVVAATMSMRFAQYHLGDYLLYARNREVFLKHSFERKNLLPIIQYINPEYWGRNDLFSKKLWVKNGRKRTMVDFGKFNQADSKYASFNHNSSWNWLCKSKITVVRSWAENFRGHENYENVLQNIVKANIDKQLPSIVYVTLMRATWSDECYRLTRAGCDPWVAIVYRSFASHAHNIWKSQGYKFLRVYLGLQAHREMGEISDWLVAEGLGLGFPAKNSTFQSLIDRTNDWHRRMAAEKTRLNNVTWESLISECTLDEVVVKPLTSRSDLALEGYDQKHCVESYTMECKEGNYRLFSLVEPDGTRSTLGIVKVKNGRNPQWIVSQHRGKHNGAVSKLASDVAMKVADVYDIARKSRSNKKKVHGD